MLKSPERVIVAPRSALITRLLALGGVLGPLIFVVAFSVAGSLRPGYSAIHQAVSDLGVGPRAWLLNISLVVMGVLLIGCCAASCGCSARRWAIPGGGSARGCWHCPDSDLPGLASSPRRRRR